MASRYAPTFARASAAAATSEDLTVGAVCDRARLPESRKTCGHRPRLQYDYREVLMNRILVFATILLFMAMPLTAANGASVAGMYVEARTAEVFVGGCLMGSEAETTGRQAVLAWKIDR